MTYTNSSLVNYTKLSPNHSGQRTHVIDTITIHCVVGQLSVETIGNIFASTSRGASCNYAIGEDGQIALIVEEKNCSWCTSSNSNDQRAITIEVASDTTHPYAVKDVVYNSLINLVADICRRNNIKQLLWQGDKSLIGQIDKQNMTVHRWFKNKACPGEWLYSRHGEIAQKVNAMLSGKWVQGWWYQNADGSYPKNQWLQLDAWYYFDEKGCAIQNDWKQVNGKWYYFNQECKMQTGWLKLNNKYYYLNSDGVMATGWVKDNGKYYYLNSEGVMQTGWIEDNGNWYYLDTNGAMYASCWITSNGKDYYLTASGAMATSCYVKSTSENIYYWVNKDGVWEPEWNTSTPNLTKYKVVV